MNEVDIILDRAHKLINDCQKGECNQVGGVSFIDASLKWVELASRRLENLGAKKESVYLHELHASARMLLKMPIKLS